jgi:alkylation response protein AidB-like acyl-CoA dehydrogenase
MEQTLYEADHLAFRDSVRAFMQRHVVPRHAEWETAGIVDRDVWVEAGKQGLLGLEVPEGYGGGGVRDFRYNAVLDEEIIRCGATGLGVGLHNDIVAPYLLELGTTSRSSGGCPGSAPAS